MTGEPYTGWRDSDYSPGCLVRKELPTRVERAPGGRKAPEICLGCAPLECVWSQGTGHRRDPCVSPTLGA